MQQHKVKKPIWAISQNIRSDRGGLVEDICKHGVGHPNKEWMEKYGTEVDKVHCCDGCCGCNLCNALEHEKDEILYEDDNVFILPTKNLKGHNKRIMMVVKGHICELSPEEEEEYMEVFAKFCESYFDEEPTYALVDSTYATITDHWHVIACDWKGLEDLQQLLYTPHIAIPTKIKWSPKK
jgi:hypothetical protein